MKRYATPAAFKVALNARLRERARSVGLPVDRVRTLAVMERFLARVVAVFPETAVLKGGMALELRLERARTTQDIDLRLLGDPDAVGAMFALAADYRVDPPDHLSFRAEPDSEHPTIRGEGAVYEGFRYSVTPYLAGERYGDSFGVDVSFADALHGNIVELLGSDAFAFVGVPPVAVRVYPLGSHLAEKLHAYTLPRRDGIENSRVKDLPDIALIATMTGLDALQLSVAIAKTFAFRGTHPVPRVVPDPPAGWTPVYRHMAGDENLPWKELPELLAAVSAFLNPVLAGEKGLWDARNWRWIESPEKCHARIFPMNLSDTPGGLLQSVLTDLADAGVGFVVCGGVACILQGVARATHDLDLRVDLETPNVERLVRVLEQRGFQPRIPEPLRAFLDPERRRACVEEKQAVVYTVHAADGQLTIGVFLRYPIAFDALWTRADVIAVEGRSIRVSSKRDLVEAKRAVQPPRKKDLRDIEDLLELMGDVDG